MFYGFVITESGNALLASMVAGQTLTITKAVVGEGTADNSDTARKLTALITPGPTATSTRPTVDGNSVNMIVEYRSDLNGGLQEGFWIGEFGVFGKVGNGEETLIGYGSLGDAKQYVSAYVSGTAPDVRRYPVSITVTTGTQVDVSYPAEAWMTAEDVDDKVNKHNSSEENHKDIRAALSNKADNGTHNLKSYTSLSQIGLSGVVSMDQVCESLPENSILYLVNDRNTMIDDAPTVYTHMVMLKKGSTDVKCYCATVGRTSVGYTNDTYQGEWENNTGSQVWSGWKQIATAMLPQEYDLPLEAGFSGTAKYSKDQFGYVHLRGRVIGVSALNTAFAYLPAGFRPIDSTTRAIGQSGSLARMDISTEGRLIIAVSGNIEALASWIDIDCEFQA